MPLAGVPVQPAEPPFQFVLSYVPVSSGNCVLVAGAAPSTSIVIESVLVAADGSVTPFVAVIVCDALRATGRRRCRCDDAYGRRWIARDAPCRGTPGKSTDAMPESGSAAFAVSWNEPDCAAFSHSVLLGAS